MDSVPKISPIWQDISLKDVFSSKHRSKHFMEKIPDYGGIGLDVCHENNEVRCSSSKSTTNHIHFSAKICALPFLTMHKVTKLSDPCLELHRQQQEKYLNFCTKLQNQRLKVNSVKNFKYKKDILSSFEKLKKNVSSKSFEGILVPEKVIELSKEISRPIDISDTNFSYTGGCLIHSHSGNSPVLLHPSGKHLNKLSIIPIEENCTDEKRFHPQNSSQHFVKLKGGSILQISSALNGVGYVRQKEFIHYINFMNLNNIQTSTMKEKGIINIEASPYNPSELLSVFSNGKLQLKNIETRKAKLFSNVFSDKYVMEHPRQCTFGSHPFSALFLSNQQLFLFDIRVKKNQVSTLFSTTHPSCYAEEELSLLKTFNTNTFQHFAASNRHLFLCDERYPTEPVMLWNHLLSSHPLYCSNAHCFSNSSSSDVVLLGSQVSREICAISLRSSMTEIQPTTLTLPFFLSSPSDCIDSLKLQCVYVDNVQCARFYNSLVGISVVPHTESNGFTCFQLTSLGDVFYQDYHEGISGNLTNNFRIGPGCILPQQDKIKSYLSHLCFGQTKVDERNLSNDSLTFIDVDLKEILQIPKEISADCINCRCENGGKEFVHTDVCPFCGLNNLQSQQLSEAAANLNVICSDSGKMNLKINIDALGEYTDSCSKNILECWFKDSSVVEDDMDLPNSQTEMRFITESESNEHLNVVGKGGDDSSFIEKLEVEIDPRTIFTESLYKDLFGGASYSEEMIPSSQDVRPLQGETLHTPFKPKPKLIQKPRAGF